MTFAIRPSYLGTALVLLAAAASAQAQVKITEVSAWGSGNAPYATDWLELTNTGGSAINISSWQMDDNSNGTGGVASALAGRPQAHRRSGDGRIRELRHVGHRRGCCGLAPAVDPVHGVATT